jgi:hypothetical protein
VVSNAFAKSIGLGGSAAIKAKSITNGGGCCVPASKASKASNGNLGATPVPAKKTLQNSVVSPGSGAKGHGGSVDKKATTKDPLQTGGSRHAK